MAQADTIVHETRRGDVLVSTDPARLDLDVVHGFLAGSYWAAGISRDTVARSLAHSICFGAYAGGRQVGFARVVTDRATYAYLADVFVLDSHRGRGLGKRLMECVVSHPDLQGLRRWTLFTRDAHGLYRQYGFATARYPDRLMERLDRSAYAGPPAAEPEGEDGRSRPVSAEPPTADQPAKGERGITTGAAGRR